MGKKKLICIILTVFLAGSAQMPICAAGLETAQGTINNDIREVCGAG